MAAVVNITLQEANDILKGGFPSSDQMKRFPFRDQLMHLYYREDEEGKAYHAHGKAVVDSMNVLLGNTPGDLISGLDNIARQRLNEVKLLIGKLFSNFDENAQALFRIAALYHDIGKYVIKERHPTVGWYTLEYLNIRDREALRSLLGNREDYLQLLLIMVRDHDVFGDLSTGEASYPVLLRAANSLGNDLYSQSQIISAMMWLNLSDVAGTPGIELNSEDLNKLIYDWHWFLKALEDCCRENEQLDNYVIRRASEEKMVIRRISRLLLESSRDVPRRRAEFRQPQDPDKQNNGMRDHWNELRLGRYRAANRGDEIEIPDQLETLIVTQWVQNQLEKVYPTQIPRRDFCIQFTHVCKLDYAKRFFQSMVEYCEGPLQSGENRPVHEWSKERVSTEDLIYSVLAILRRMTSTYAPMVRIENGMGNLIGVEMKDLTPKNAPEKTSKIIQLLRDSHYPGLSWLMSDCLAWYL